MIRTLVPALVLLCAPNALAYVNGAEPLGPEPNHELEGPYELVSTGGSLLNCMGGMGGGSACTGLRNTAWQASGLPEAGRFERAWMIWSHSRNVGEPIDTSIMVALPDADDLILEADLDEECVTFEDPCLDLMCGTFQAAGWATCRHDVTDVMNAHLEAGGRLNGEWQAADLEIADSHPDDLMPDLSMWRLGSLVVGGVVFVGAFEPEDGAHNRRIYVYNGLQYVEGPENFDMEVAGFDLPPDPHASVLVHILEGDTGIQGDQILLGGQPLADGCNPANNVFNGTVNTGDACRQGVHGVDLDLFEVGDLIPPGEDSITLRMVVGGEALVTNFVVVLVDSVPKFIKPVKGANPPNNRPVRVGDEVTYTIDITNGGDAPAHNVVITDPVPDGAEYVEGSTRIDGEVEVPHPLGAAISPLQQGLPLTDILGAPIPNSGADAHHQVSFSVSVTEVPLPDGRLRNRATLAADGIDPQQTNEVVHPVHEAAEGEGEGPAEGEGEEGEGEGPAEGEGEEGEGEGPAEGEGEGEGAAEGEGEGEGEGGVQCGPGTHLEGGACVADCGEGTVYRDGLCVPDEGGSGEGSSAPTRRGGCSCGVTAVGAPAGGLWLLAVLGLTARRRRH